MERKTPESNENDHGAINMKEEEEKKHVNASHVYRLFMLCLCISVPLSPFLLLLYLSFGVFCVNHPYQSKPTILTQRNQDKK